MKWIKTSDQLPQAVTGDRSESIPCLVKYKGWVAILSWNCHYQSWDDEDGDDHCCDALQVDSYVPLSEILKILG